MSINNKVFDHTESITHSFGRQVIRKRIEQGLTRNQLAIKSKISYKWLAMLERNEVDSISLYVCVAISNALDFYEWDLIQITRF